MARIPRTRDGRKTQRGYILLAILLLVTLMAIALAATAPAIATQVKRQNEEELIHRGNQYKRAFQLFYRKFGRYPASLDQLENTNNLRFLRKRYKDPITRTDDWRLIHVGEALSSKKPKIAGATPASQLGSPFGAPANSPFGAGSGGLGGTNPTAQAGGINGTGQPSGVNGSSGSSRSEGAIVGVASSSTKESLKELEGKGHYNEWEFVYDPTQDRKQGIPGAGGMPGATPAGERPNSSPFSNTPGAATKPGSDTPPQTPHTPENPQ